MDRKYYEAYDCRYRQVHKENLQWSHKAPSAIVMETMEAFSITPEKTLLEIGCGEGRDALPLLAKGFDLLATDVSPEAVRFCQNMFPQYAGRFQVLDAVSGRYDGSFDFIYAVAVVHMLVLDEDRNAFYRFIREHLNDAGIALICTMGDGSLESRTDICTAFDSRERVHEQSGKVLQIANTSCRRVSFQTFGQELQQNGLTVLRQGITAVALDFPQLMYAVVEAKRNF